jgi:membrane dipeptidase
MGSVPRGQASGVGKRGGDQPLLNTSCLGGRGGAAAPPPATVCCELHLNLSRSRHHRLLPLVSLLRAGANPRPAATGYTSGWSEARASLLLRVSLWLPLAVLGAVLAPLPVTGAQPADRPPAVVDLHVDLPYQANYRGQRFAVGSGQYVASRLVRAGVVGVVLPLYVPHDVSPVGPRLSDLEWSYARLFAHLCQTRPLGLPGCRAAAGRVQTWLAFEGAGPLAAQPDLLTWWVARGIRLVGLVHSRDNELATSAGMQPTARRVTHGLSPEGREVVRRAHALGVLVDVSHASDLAADEVLRMAAAQGAPAVASHSNARAVYSHSRNLTDAQIRAVAATGGVVGVNFHSAYLGPGPRARLRDVVRHVLHIHRLVGIDHVAIGSDFEGGIRPPPELQDVTGYARLAAALRKAGLSRAQVQRVFSGNALRLLCGRQLPPPAP